MQKLTWRYLYFLLTKLVLLGLIMMCLCSVRAQVRAYPDEPSAHILTVVKYTPDPSIKAEPVTGFDKSSLVSNRAKTFQAYILCIPVEKKLTDCGSRVFFTEARIGTVYMISGEPEDVERMRPVDELKWLDNDRLSYERWMSPHFGHRYVINVRLKKQTAAFALSDTGR
jgi:hypothetical protein